MARKVSPKVIDVLIGVYTAEIGAVGVYMDQHVKCADMGYQKLADLFKADALDEMKHAERLAERILALGATLRYEKHDVPDQEMTDISDMLKTNINLEIIALERLNKGISICFRAGDNASRMLLDEILQEEDRHLSAYETMLANIEKYGDQYVVNHLM